MIIKKPPTDNVTDDTNSERSSVRPIYVPEHSIAVDELTNQIIIKVDDGKFMDSVFEYTNDWYVDENNVLNYNALSRRLVINGIERDPVQVTLEQKKEFRDVVATPVLHHVIMMLQQQEDTDTAKENNDTRA